MKENKKVGTSAIQKALSGKTSGIIVMASYYSVVFFFFYFYFIPKPGQH